tara:strand:+ start:70 stop:801 length:732 start_codon:yes stop_codon:yes gene_type:complete
MKTMLKNIVESQSSRAGYLFDLFIQIMIVLSLLAFSFETIPNLSDTTLSYLHYFEVISIIIFTLEYILRIYVADRRMTYIFSFYGFIDLVAILPFYISGSVDLRSLRAVRLLRVLRLLKLFRFNESLILLSRAFRIVKREMIVFSFIAVILLYVSSVGIYFFENPVQPDEFGSIFDCMWWAISTMTTVGYGDIVPITIGGKIFTSIISFIGIGVVSIPTALLASSLTNLIKVDKEDDQQHLWD